MGIKQIISRQAGIISDHLHLQVEIYTFLWIVQWFKVKRVFFWPFLLPRKSLYSNFSEHLSMNHRKNLSLDKFEIATMIFFQSKRCVQQIHEWAYIKKVKFSCFFVACSFNTRQVIHIRGSKKKIYQPYTTRAKSETQTSDLVERNLAYVCQTRSYNDNPLKTSLEESYIFQSTILRN